LGGLRTAALGAAAVVVATLLGVGAPGSPRTTLVSVGYDSPFTPIPA